MIKHKTYAVEVKPWLHYSTFYERYTILNYISFKR